MELVELDFALPSIFFETEKRLSALNLGEYFDYVIAGGALCNVYLGETIKDIDIFIEIKDWRFDSKERIEEALLDVFHDDNVIVETRDVPGYRGWLKIPNLFRIQFMGYTLEFIPAPIERIYDFDLRFRQFYFRNGKLYASKGALDDIEEKQLTVVSPVSPLSTLSRLFRFEEQFGFSVHPKSIDFILSFCNRRFHYDYVVQYVENAENLTKYAKKRISDLLSKAVPVYISDKDFTLVEIPDVDFPFDKELEDAVFNYFSSEEYHGFGLFYEDLEEENRFQLHPIELSFPFSYIRSSVEPFIEKVNNVIKKSRLRMLTAGYTFQFKEIPSNELSIRYHEYFRNKSIISMLNYVRFEHLYEELMFPNDYILENGYPIPTHLSIRFAPIKDYYTSIGDLMTGNYLMMIVNESFYYRMRRCTNGKYTIGALPNRKSNQGESLYLKGIGMALKEQYPELFDFDNPELVGVFSYGSSPACDYFFRNFKEKNPTFLDNKEKYFYRKINLNKDDV